MNEPDKYGWVEPSGWTWLWLKPHDDDADEPYELVVMGTRYESRATASVAMALDATKGQTHFVAFMRCGVDGYTVWGTPK